jgi:hypothetical protein
MDTMDTMDTMVTMVTMKEQVEFFIVPYIVAVVLIVFVAPDAVGTSP